MDEKITASLETIEKGITNLQSETAKIAELEKGLARVNELEREIAHLKAGAPEAGKTSVEKRMADRVKILRAAAEGQSAVTKAISETVGTSAGALGSMIPEEWAAEISQNFTTFGELAAAAKIVPMTRQTLNYPQYVNGITGAFIGAGTTITSGAPSAVNTTLTAKKVAGFTIYDKEFLADADANVAASVTRDISENLARAFEYALCSGNGTDDSTNGAITGILNAATNVVTAATGAGSAFSGAVTKLNLATLIDSITADIQGEGLFVMHKTLRPLIRALAENSAYVGVINADASRIFGYRVIYVSGASMPTLSQTATGTKFLAFIDSSALIIGMRSGVEITTSTDALFQQDQVAVKGIMRAHAFCIGGRMAVLKTANS